MLWMDNHLDQMIELRERKCRMQPIILKAAESAKFGVSLTSNGSEPIQLEAFDFVDKQKKLALNGVKTLQVELSDKLDQLEHIVVEELSKSGTGLPKPETEKEKPETGKDNPETGSEKPVAEPGDKIKEGDETESQQKENSKIGDEHYILVVDNTALHHNVQIIDLSGNIDSFTAPPAKVRAVPVQVPKGKSLKLEATGENEKENILLNGQEKLEVYLNSQKKEVKIKITASKNGEDGKQSEGAKDGQKIESKLDGGNETKSSNKEEGEGISPEIQPTTVSENTIGGMDTKPPGKDGDSGQKLIDSGHETGVSLKGKCSVDEEGRNTIMLAMNNT